VPEAAGLYYELHGLEDGQPLILSPGLGGSASYWQPNLAAFAERFRAKGRFADRMANLPVRLAIHPDPGLLGAAAAFQEHLRP